MPRFSGQFWSAGILAVCLCLPLASDPAPDGPCPDGRELAGTRFLGVPLSGVLRGLGEATGVSLRASSQLAEVKVTLVSSRSEPLRAHAARLAELLSARWRRSRDGWILERDPETARWLDEWEEARRRLRLQARAEQAASFRRAHSRAVALLDQGKPPAADGAESGEGFGGEGSLVRLLDSFGAREKERLFASNSMQVRTGDRGLGLSKIPRISRKVGDLTPAQQGFLRQFLDGTSGAAEGSGLRAPDPDSIRFWTNEDTVFLSFDWRDGRRGDARVFSAPPGPAWMALRFAHMGSPEHPAPANGEELLAQVRARFAASSALLAGLDRLYPARADVAWNDLDSAEAVAELSRATGLPMCADYHTLENRLTLNGRGMPLSALLAPIVSTFEVEPRAEGPAILLRAVCWPDRDSRELSQAVLERLMRTRRRLPRPWIDHPSLAGLAEAARLVPQDRVGSLLHYRERGHPAKDRLLLSQEAEALIQERELMDLLAALPEETLRLVTGAGVPIQDRRLPRPVLGAFLDRYAPDAGGTRMELRLRLRETEPITVHPEWRCSFWVLEILARRGASQVLVATHRTDVPAALYRIPAASPTREDVR